MVLDYSKWDALELSDDSDIEVHPNVDKRSFIRAKQNQIHQEREHRRHEIQTLKYERIINDGLLSRIEKLLGALKQHEGLSRNPEELVFSVIMEFASNPAEDQTPAPPEGVHTHEKEQPKYSQIMSALVDQVKREIGEPKSEELFGAYITGVQAHNDKVQGLQKELLQRLAQLEKQEGSKITSENLHTGFDTSHVAKSADNDKAPSGGQTDSVELLNPGAASKDVSKSGSKDDDEPEDPESVRPSDLARQFAKIKLNDYRTLLQFIGEHPDVVAEKETDGLLVEAFNSQLEGKEDYARQCVHHGLLLQYCRSLGRDGVSLFFKRCVQPFPSNSEMKQLTWLPALQPKNTKLQPYSETTSTKPTPKSSPEPPSSPKTPQPPTTQQVSNKSSCTQLNPTRRSPSTFPPKEALIRKCSKLARSSSPSPQSCKSPYYPSLWMR